MDLSYCYKNKIEKGRFTKNSVAYYFKTNFNPLCFTCFDNMAARIVATVQVGLFCGKHCVWWWWHGWRADDRAGSWAAI